MSMHLCAYKLTRVSIHMPALVLAFVTHVAHDELMPECTHVCTHAHTIFYACVYTSPMAKPSWMNAPCRLAHSSRRSSSG